MKIGIDYRMLSMGPAVLNRGMGRYTQQQLREVLRIDTENEYLLLCREGAATDALLPEIRNHSQVRLTYMPELADLGPDPNGPTRVLDLAADFHDWLAAQKLDLYHATTPFLLGDLVVPFVDTCRVLVTHYDLIPYIFRDRYFGDDPSSVSRAVYMRALGFLSRADWALAISSHVRRELESYLGFPSDRIGVAHPVADPVFRQLAVDEAEKAVSPLRERLDLRGGFILAVSHFHHSKNLPLLFEAYNRLSPALRGQHPLVLTCQLLPAEMALVRQWAADAGVGDDLVLTGLVTDEELVALYNRATVFVHPSRYEGFGLPVLEAMRCGAPVVTTNAASLPEVAGGAALLVGPDDSEAMAKGITRLVTHPEVRAEFRERSRKRAEGAFSPEALGRSTLQGYRDALDAPVRDSRSTKRIAIWSPVPPQASGIADYTAELLPELQAHAQVEVFVDDEVLPEPGILQWTRAHHHKAFGRRSKDEPFDAVLFQMGASFFHLFIEKGLLRFGGSLVLHDLTWGFIRHALASGSGDLRKLESEIKRLEGKQALAEFQKLRQAPEDEIPGLLEDFFNQHYLLGPLVEASDVQIVHMPEAAEDLAQRYESARPRSLMMGVKDPWACIRAPGWSRLPGQIRSSPAKLLIGAFGIVDPVKRVDRLIQAVSTLKAEGLHAQLIVVGPLVTEEYGHSLRQLARAEGVADRVFFLGKVSSHDLDRLLVTVDVVANLRFPFRKQMSATLVRGIAAGKPVVISDVDFWSFLPGDFCYRVAPDSSEVTELAHRFRTLIEDPERRLRMGAAARSYYLEHATPRKMAESYLHILEEVAGTRFPRAGRDLEQATAASPLPPSKLYAVEDLDDRHLQEAVRALWPVEREPGVGRPLPSSIWCRAMSLLAIGGLGELDADQPVAVFGDTPLLAARLAEMAGSVLMVPPDAESDLSPLYRSALNVRPETEDRVQVRGAAPMSCGISDGSLAAVSVGLDPGHLGSLDDLALLAREVGRITRPGGYVSWSLRYRVMGPPGGKGPAGLPVIDQADLEPVLLVPGGLEVVGELRWDLSPATLASDRDLEACDEVEARWGAGPILLENGYVLATLHLWLRRVPGLERGPVPVSSESPVTLSATSGVGGEVEKPGEAPSSGGVAGVSVAEQTRIWAGSDLRSFLDRWDKVRSRTALQVASTGPFWRRALGFAERSLKRVRDLGIAWDRLRDLLQALVDRNIALGSEVKGLEGRLDDVDVHLTEHVRRLDSMEQNMERLVRLQELVEVSSEVLSAVDLSNGPHRTRPLDGGGDLRRRLEAIRDSCQLESFQPALELLDRLESRLSLVRPQPTQVRRQVILSLPDQEKMVELLRRLETEDPLLMEADSLEVTIQGRRREEVLLAVVEHFGDRLSSMDPSGYRLPNDACIYLHPAPFEPGTELWAHAAVRLKSTEGLLVVLTTAMPPEIFDPGPFDLRTVVRFDGVPPSCRVGLIYRHQLDS